MNESAAATLLAALCLAAAAPAFALEDCMNRGGDALPAQAYYVDPSRSFHLQEELDRHGMIRLKPAGDYTRAPSLVLRSGQQVYGLAGTRLPRVLVAGGTSGAVLSGVAPDGLRFEPSDEPIHGNCFERISTAYSSDPLTIVDTIAVGNLFLDVGPGAVRIDTRRRGYLRDNRFIKLEMHGVSPSLTLLGSRERPSLDNVFLWTNILTPDEDGVIVGGQEEANFVGLDAESWNWSGHARLPAMMNVSDTGVLRLFMAHGGDNSGHYGGILDSDAERLEIYGLKFGQAGSPAIMLGEHTARMLNVLSQSRPTRDPRPGGGRLEIYPDFRPTVRLNGRELPAAGSAAAGQLELRALVGGDAPIHGPVWTPARLDPPRTPKGVVPPAQRPAQRDAAEEIQKRIEAEGIAQLPAGVYYVSRPLRLAAGQGIVGAGAARTAIVAMRPDIDLVIGARQTDGAATIGFVLADISLIGGRAGIRHDADGSGSGTQYNHIVLSHVTIRDMREAGIYVGGIYGWDNNLIDHLNVVDCDVGFKQVVPASYEGGDRADMTYLDKNVFYRSQFIGGRKAFEWPAKRPNNLDLVVDSLIRGATQRALDTQNTDSLIFANVDFIDNAGDPQIAANLPVGCVGCRFRASGHGGSLLDDHALCEGCQFTGSGPNAPSIGRRGSSVFLFNSRVAGMELGSGVSAFLVNTVTAGRAGGANAVEWITPATSRVLVPGQAHPAPQLLVGHGIH